MVPDLLYVAMVPRATLDRRTYKSVHIRIFGKKSTFRVTSYLAVAQSLSPLPLHTTQTRHHGRAMDDVSYLLRVPTELLVDILSRLLQISRQKSLADPYSLVGHGSGERDEKTARLLATVCKTFYDIVAPRLADRMELRSVSALQTPGRFCRSALDTAPSPYLPSTLVVDLRHRVDAGAFPLAQHPAFCRVSNLRLVKPSWWIGKTFPDFVRELATCIGPQIQTVFALPGKDSWFVEDLVVLSCALPHLRQLSVPDLHYVDEIESDDDLELDHGLESASDIGSDQSINRRTENVDSERAFESDRPVGSDQEFAPGVGTNADMAVKSLTSNAFDAQEGHKSDDRVWSNLDTGVVFENLDEEVVPVDVNASVYEAEHVQIQPPIAVFRALEWLTMGQTAWTRRVAAHEGYEGFELFLAGLNVTTCPNLKRIDVLQDVGPLDGFLARYDAKLECLCLSSSVLSDYIPSLSASPSLLTLRVIVDSIPDFRPVSHASLTTVSIYLPVKFWSFSGPGLSLYTEFLLDRIVGSFFGLGLPSLQTLWLFSEVPLPAQYLEGLRVAASATSFDLMYVDVPL